MISNTINEEIEVESILYNEALKRNVKDKASRMDLLLLTENSYLINIEVNTKQDETYFYIRNFDYIYYLYKRSSESNNKIKDYINNKEIKKLSKESYFL